MTDRDPQPEHDDDNLHADPTGDRVNDAAATADAPDAPDAPDDDALAAVDALGGDADIMASLPNADELLDADDDIPAYDPFAGTLDIEAALASVATLSDVIAEREEAEEREQRLEAERERRDAERAAAQAAARPARPMPLPPPAVLRRGQAASVAPALALIAIGAWLTLAFTTPDAAPPPYLIAGVAVGAFVVCLLVYWLERGRWASGALFIALLLGGAGAAIYATAFTFQPQYTLAALFGAAAAAFALTGVAARPGQPRLWIMALVCGLAAGVSAAYAAGALGVVTADMLTRYSLIALLAFAILWGLPVLFRRRQPQP